MIDEKDAPAACNEAVVMRTRLTASQCRGYCPARSGRGKSRKEGGCLGGETVRECRQAKYATDR